MTVSSIRRAGIAMVAVTLAARGIGFLREAVIAHGFGASRELDIYLVSLTVPAIAITTVYYSIPNAFVSLWINPGKTQGRAVRISIYLVVFSVLLASALWIYSDRVIMSLAPGFSQSVLTQAGSLLRIGSLAIVFAMLEALLRSRLLATKKFALAGLSYAWQALSIIVAAIWWHNSGSFGLMWGFTIGTALSAAWSGAISIAHRESRGEPRDIAEADQQAGAAWIWIMVVLVTDSLAQLYALVDRYLGTYLEPGAISALNYASMTVGLASAIVGVAISTAILPYMSEAHAEMDVRRIRAIIDRTVSWLLIFMTPVTVWLVTFSSEISAFLFRRGAFDDVALNVTSNAVAAAALGIIPIGVATVLSRTFYASRSWIPIVVIAAGALLSKLLLARLLVERFGSTGLALSTTAAYLVAAGITCYMQREMIMSSMLGWCKVTAKTFVLVIIPAIVARLFVSSAVSGNSVMIMILTAAAIALGLVLLVLVGRIWGIQEMDEITSLLRLSRTRN